MGSIAILNCLDSANTQVDHHGGVAVRLGTLASCAIGQKLSFDFKIASAPCWHNPLVALFIEISRLGCGVSPEIISVDSKWPEWIVHLVSDLLAVYV